MPETMKPEDMHKALFVNLIMMLGSSVMQQLGKLINPMTNQTETNLEGAQSTIDMIAMLQAKTKGNLDKDESKMISDLLSSLQMNFVETSQSSTVIEKEETTEEKKEEIEDKSDTEPTADTPKEAEKTDPKYHKSYGA